MKKKLILILAIISVFNQNAFSCECKGYTLDSLQKVSYELSDIVFLGELITSDRESSNYFFKIYETFKGNDSLEVVIGRGFTTCSTFPYEKGLWLVYADFVGGDTIDISVCLASRSFKNPIIYPPEPPASYSGKKETLEQEIEILKRDIEREKMNRMALVELIAEVEKLRFMKNKVNR